MADRERLRRWAFPPASRNCLTPAWPISIPAMLGSARQFGRLLRLPALALLLLAVLANPVLAAVGDLHEASRGSSTHLHGVGEHTLADDLSRGEEAQAGDLMHALMHGAHCCGHLTALPSSFALATATLPRLEAPRTAHLQHPSARVSTTIRPPIAA